MDFKRLVSVASTINVLILLTLVQYQGLQLGFNRPTINAVSLLTAMTWGAWIVFRRWLWKTPLLQGWLVKVPNLNGIWVGEIHSTWGRKKLEPIAVEVAIKQDLLHITVDAVTNEMSSQSVVASIICDEHRNTAELQYTYQSEPNPLARDKSPIHQGAVKLTVKPKGRELTLHGEYWTTRKTTGSMFLKRPTDL